MQRLTDVIVRRAVSEDSAVMATLLDQLGYRSSEEEVRSRFVRLLQQSKVAVFVASRDSEVRGLATTHHLSVLNRDRDLAQLTALVVDKSARRLGIGRALVGAVEAYARDAGCERLSVTTYEGRDDAHAFYAGIGFALTGRRYGKMLP